MRSGSARSSGISGSRGAGPQSRSWVPRVYLASSSELVQLVVGLSWLGVKAAGPAWQPVLSAVTRAANSGLLEPRQLPAVLPALRRIHAGADSHLLDALAARFMDCLPELLERRPDGALRNDGFGSSSSNSGSMSGGDAATAAVAVASAQLQARLIKPLRWF
jgi:hypothetical protein